MHWLDQVDGLRFDGAHEYDPNGVPPVGCIIGSIPGDEGVTDGYVWLVDPDGEDEEGNTVYTAWTVYR